MTDDNDSPNNHSPHPPNTSPSFAWRLFFGFNCLLVFLNIISVPYFKVIGILEIIDFTFTNLIFIGLCGFIFRKPLGNVVFWRYFFYATIIEDFIVLGLFPLFGVELYGGKMTFTGWLINVTYTIGNLIALNLYAYKMNGLWQR